MQTDNDDYQALGPSPRHRAADALAAFILDNGLAESHGGKVERANDRTHYYVGFSRRTGVQVDGEVRVYGLEYFKVTFRQRLPRGWSGHHLYGSREECCAFLDLAFRQGNMEEALKVPQKVTTPRGAPKPKKESTDARGRRGKAGPAAGGAAGPLLPASFPPDYFGTAGDEAAPF